MQMMEELEDRESIGRIDEQEKERADSIRRQAIKLSRLSIQLDTVSEIIEEVNHDLGLSVERTHRELGEVFVMFEPDEGVSFEEFCEYIDMCHFESENVTVEIFEKASNFTVMVSAEGTEWWVSNLPNPTEHDGD
jgi:hypothetical protein